MSKPPEPDDRIDFSAPRTVARPPRIEMEVLPVQAAPEGRRSSRAVTRVNLGFALLLVALVVTAAIPAGSNVPIFWMVWTGTVFLLLGLHLGLMAWLDPDRPLAVLRHRQWIAPMLCLIYLVWVGIQTLPLNLAPPLPRGIEAPTISVLPQAGWLGLLRQAGYLAFFVLSLEVVGRNNRVDLMARVLFAGICLHALWGMVAVRFLDDFFLWGEKTAYLGVATGTFINRNNFAAFLGVGLVLGAAIVADLVHVPRVRKAGSTLPPRPSVLEALLPVAGMALLVVTILATQSRMGMFSAAFGAATVFAIMRLRQGVGGTRVSAEAVLAVALLGGPVIALSGTEVIERALDIGNERNGRLELWRQVWAMLGDRPWTGFGLDSFYAAFELYHQPPLTSALVWEYVHNSYLSLWVETGIVFGSLPILAAVWVWAMSLRRAFQARSHFAIPAAGAGIGIALGLASAVDFPLEIQANMFLYLLVMAMASAPRHRQGEEG